MNNDRIAILKIPEVKMLQSALFDQRDDTTHEEIVLLVGAALIATLCAERAACLAEIVAERELADSDGALTALSRVELRIRNRGSS
jgi:hypothetical protein